MRLCLQALCYVAFIIGQSGQSPTAVSEKPLPGNNIRSSLQDELVGAWRLISVETVRANGEVIYPFYGRHPEGLLIYDRSGWMSVQIISDPKPGVPLISSREGFLAASPSEKSTAADGFYAYFGTWTADASSSTVTHNILQSFYPGERGTEGKRALVLQGNRLILVAQAHEMGENHERKLVWERISGGH